ncbi:MAG: hypothetical protein CL561_02055 [Alphaproteobacteria bacterium]|nr:hypothetical protein [Alphaproteobacteria bacterium]|tara:strand:+ start:80609 stop:81016 length:408 start_codon:yes stop_codon:yes gene_type:complete
MSSQDKNANNAILSLLRMALFCTCPKCHQGKIFQDGFLKFDLKEKCDQCGLDLSRSDSADGPAVFLIFFLGFLLVPLALIVEVKFGWPVWVHVLVWGSFGLILTLGALKPIKSFVIALQYKYRKSDWDDNPPPRV